VRDDDGASDTELGTGQVVVYDPAAGSVTGGGWIASPAGAYAAAPAAAGKLTFALLVRYPPAATVPTGNADFKLNVSKLDFRSTAFDWLAIAGSSVRIQGRGTVNGTPGYAFAVVARDGVSNDAIRVQIWHITTGAVLYDNQPGDPILAARATVVGGGSVQYSASRRADCSSENPNDLGRYHARGRLRRRRAVMIACGIPDTT
jgi:hypothetical protein